MFPSEWCEFPSAPCMCSLYYRGADKCLARPGRKQTKVSAEWREYPAVLCLAGEKKLDDSTCLDVVEIARVPDMLPRLFPSWSG